MKRDVVNHTLGDGHQLRWLSPDGRALDLPKWAHWFIDLGAVHAVAKIPIGQRRWTIVTVPDRRYAAVLVAHGAIRAQLHRSTLPSVAERFADSEPGDFLTWIDTNGDSRFGKLSRVEDGRIYYTPREHGGWGISTSRPIENAATGSFWPSSEEDEFVRRGPAANDGAFATAAMGLPPDRFLAMDGLDVRIVGTRTDLEDELNDRRFIVEGHQGAFLDTVRPKGLVGIGQRHRSGIISASADLDDQPDLECVGPTIFDGGAAYLRLRDELAGTANVVILDRWHPRSEEAAKEALMERMQTFVESAALEVETAPPGIELFTWMEEL